MAHDPASMHSHCSVTILPKTIKHAFMNAIFRMLVVLKCSCYNIYLLGQWQNCLSSGWLLCVILCRCCLTGTKVSGPKGSVLSFFYWSEFRKMLMRNYERIFSCGAGHDGLVHKQFHVFKRRQAYSAIPPTAFSVSQTANGINPKMMVLDVSNVNNQKKVQLPLVSQKSKWFCLQRVSTSQNTNLFVIVLLWTLLLNVIQWHQIEAIN